jgi:hypothetical protein
MNTSTSFRLFSAAVAFGITASIFGAVVSLANIDTDNGTTTLMALGQQAPTGMNVVIALAN